MLERFRQRGEGDEGITVIELTVVVLIIGVMIAVALPTFVGARQRAQDRAAQSDLRKTIAAAKSYYMDADTYAGADSGTPLALTAIEPSLGFVTTDSAAGDQIAVEVGDVSGSDGQIFAVARMSGSGTCFGMTHVASGANAGTWKWSTTSGLCAADTTFTGRNDW